MSNIVLDSPNGVGRFVPTNISNCVLWLDAADVGTLNLTGSTVNTWTDKASSIPFGRKNGTGITYSNSLVNLASDAFLKNNSGSITIGQTFTFFLVASNTTGTQAAAIYLSTAGSGQPGIYVEWATPTNYRFTYRFPIGQGGGTTVLIPVSSGVLPLTIGTFYRVASGANYQLGMGINGSLQPTTTPDTTSGPLDSCSVLAFGTNYQNDNQTNRPLTGAIAEIIVYNAELSAAQREQVEGYLAWKWDLQTSLPIGHPYRNIPTFTLTTTDQFQPIDIPNSELSFVGFRPITFNNPQDIATLEYWFDASDPSTISASGTTLTTWTNKGTAGSEGNISVEAGTPTTEVASQNRLNCIGLPAGSSLRFTSQFTNQPRTRFIATRPTVDTTSVSVIFLYQGGDSINGYDYVGFEGASGALEVAQGQIVNLQTNAMPQHQNTFYIYTFLNGSTAARNRIAFTGAPQALITDVAANQYFGGSVTTYINNNSIATSSSAQEIGEILSYNSELPLHETQIVEGYLAWKWGAQASLPLDHPFRLFPPPPYVIPPSPPPPPFSGWSIVLDGADASVNNNGGGSYTCNGPNDSGGSGWAYIYAFFSSAGSITYNYDFATFDGIFYDWPFEYVTSNDPSNPANVDFNTKIASSSFETGTRTVNYGANQYVVLGVYSIDSIFGNGVCTFSGLPT